MELAFDFVLAEYVGVAQIEVNSFSSYQDKLRFEREKELLVRFYSQYRLHGSDSSILFEMKDDSEMKIIESMDFLDKLLSRILQNKNEKYQRILNAQLAADGQELQNGKDKELMVAEKHHPSRVPIDVIKDKIRSTVVNFSKSHLNNQSLLPCYIAMSFWTEFARHYTSTINDLLVRLHRQKLATKMINSVVVERTVGLLNTSDSYNAHLRAFVDEYNEFYLSYPDILCQDEVKGEFHWRLDNKA